MSFVVLKQGMLALVQDYGRYGFQNIGVISGGPLDEKAFLWNNYLLGNDYNCPQIEVTYGGFFAQFKKETVIAICGADLNIKLNGVKIKPWHTYKVNKNDNIEFNNPLSGLRSYIAVKGGFKVENQLFSCSTVVREKLGGLHKNGKKLIEGDVLEYDVYDGDINIGVNQNFVPKYKKEITLRYMASKLPATVEESTHNVFTSQTYEITNDIDRMGYRLSGEPLIIESDSVISYGTSLGMIQVPKDGQPIILMKDRQSMGGYPIIGCVSYLDISLLAQSIPSTKVVFEKIDIDSVSKELIEYNKFFNIMT